MNLASWYVHNFSCDVLGGLCLSLCQRLYTRLSLLAKTSTWNVMLLLSNIWHFKATPIIFCFLKSSKCFFSYNLCNHVFIVLVRFCWQDKEQDWSVSIYGYLSLLCFYLQPPGSPYWNLRILLKTPLNIAGTHLHINKDRIQTLLAATFRMFCKLDRNSQVYFNLIFNTFFICKMFQSNLGHVQNIGIWFILHVTTLNN